MTDLLRVDRGILNKLSAFVKPYFLGTK